jgi:hypothetical protein
MFLSISHWPVDLKGTMEKERGQLAYIGGNPSRKRGYSRSKSEHSLLSRVIVSATRPRVHSISAEKVPFFSPIKNEAKNISQIEKEAVNI